ncbi:hypothetical protein GRI58_08350 [Porphyrobacter algicida]|uniref:Uncharacterized protein n=1 Tax=Qipengyuania algicida TaxID=1836209 RepID=A0A845AIU0_9SPHN|nr:hypothetical protein [Qipengyuania algicida]MXP28831.1 hypothetical protein [Qipengyuania algicida]
MMTATGSFVALLAVSNARAALPSRASSYSSLKTGAQSQRSGISRERMFSEG